MPDPPPRSLSTTRALSRTLVILLLPTLYACGAFGGRGDGNPFLARDARQVTIVVENHHSDPVLVEVIAPGRRMTLGRVPAGGRVPFTVVWSEPRDVSFQIDPILSPRYVTATIRVAPGDDLELLVQEPVHLSVIHR